MKLGNEQMLVTKKTNDDSKIIFAKTKNAMLKVGLIGAGHLGKFHLNNWVNIEGVQLIGFTDTDDDNAIQVAEKYNIPRFTEVEKLIDACFFSF